MANVTDFDPILDHRRANIPWIVNPGLRGLLLWGM